MELSAPLARARPRRVSTVLLLLTFQNRAFPVQQRNTQYTHVPTLPTRTKWPLSWKLPKHCHPVCACPEHQTIRTGNRNRNPHRTCTAHACGTCSAGSRACSYRLLACVLMYMINYLATMAGVLHSPHHMMSRDGVAFQAGSIMNE